MKSNTYLNNTRGSVSQKNIVFRANPFTDFFDYSC